MPDQRLRHTLKFNLRQWYFLYNVLTCMYRQNCKYTLLRTFSTYTKVKVAKKNEHVMYEGAKVVWLQRQQLSTYLVSTRLHILCWQSNCSLQLALPKRQENLFALAPPFPAKTRTILISYMYNFIYANKIRTTLGQEPGQKPKP